MRVVKGPGSKHHEDTMKSYNDHIAAQDEIIKARTSQMNAAAIEYQRLQGELSSAKFTPKIEAIESKYPKPENEVIGTREVIDTDGHSALDGGIAYKTEDIYKYDENDMNDQMDTWCAKVTAEYPEYFNDKAEQQKMVDSLKECQSNYNQAKRQMEEALWTKNYTSKQCEELAKQEVQIQLSDDDFDEQGLLKADIRKQLESLHFDDKQIKIFELLQGIKKATMELRATVSPESRKHLDSVIKLASLDNTSASAAKNRIERIKEEIGRATTELQSKIESTDEQFKSKQTGPSGVLQFFKNLIHAIQNKDNSPLPFKERLAAEYTKAEDAHNLGMTTMRGELKSLRAHNLAIPEQEQEKAEEEHEDHNDSFHA